MAKTLIYILTDSVTNSVFDGQVLTPLLKQLDENPTLNITLLSFEGRMLTRSQKKALNDRHPRLSIRLFYRFRFWFLQLNVICVWIFKHFTRRLKQYDIIARGPLAGWIALKGANLSCTSIVIQARGLMAEEYWFEKKSQFFSKPIHWIRFYQFKKLEQKSYTTLLQSSPYNVSIETVSSALKKYLINTYKTPSELITIAQKDIPSIIPAQQVLSWKEEMRKELGIEQHRYVYCYAGSAKSWQCPQQIITFFKEVHKKDSSNFLLIFTQEPEIFNRLLKKNNIQKKDYLVTTVSHAELTPFLAAADAGLIFRDEHILNWVSRPTKALEYQRVGLKIIHNNTVAYLSEQSNL